jgi:D-alanyl-D-alanine carboxypeptidase (penicillin-binding protein 5/6)
MLTALVALEHLEPSHIVIVGGEIRNMPAGFATGLHTEGETITVSTLLHILIIRSGNETGRVLAREVARVTTGRRNIPYEEAMQVFSVLLNEKLRELGAEHSNFNNPYGLHSPHHFTTAYDMALVTRAFMENEYLARIAGTWAFEGDSLGGQTIQNAVVHMYQFTNTNLMLPGGPHGHPYITGARTGFTTPAGHCLAAKADNGQLQLVAVVMGGVEGQRWEDTRRLIDHGFQNYGFRQIARAGEIIDLAAIYNPRLGEAATMHVRQRDGASELLSHAEYAALTRTMRFSPAFTENTEDMQPIDIQLALLGYEVEPRVTLTPPFEEGEALGYVVYTVDGREVFSSPIIATRDVMSRTFDSDMDYYIARFFAGIFTRAGLPWWLAAGGVAFGLFGMVLAANAVKKLKSYRRY